MRRIPLLTARNIQSRRSGPDPENSSPFSLIAVLVIVIGIVIGIGIGIGIASCLAVPLLPRKPQPDAAR